MKKLSVVFCPYVSELKECPCEYEEKCEAIKNKMYSDSPKNSQKNI